MTVGFDEIQLDERLKNTIVTLRIKEKLTKQDYETFVPMIESQLQKGSPIRLIIELHDFEGRTAGALWEDTKFAAKHLKHIERMAVVGESRWQMGVALFFKPFTTSEVRYFGIQAIDEARQWVRRG